MEPLTALSLAAGVVQLLDFGGRLLQTSLQVHRSTERMTEELMDLELTTADLKALVTLFSPPAWPTRGLTTNPDRELQSLAGRGLKLSQELLGIIVQVKRKGNQQSQTWQAVSRALKTIRRGSEIQGICKRLEILKSQLLLRLLELSRDEQSVIHMTLDALVADSHKAQIANAQGLKQVKDDLLAAAVQHSREMSTVEARLHADLEDQQLRAEELIQRREQDHRKISDLLQDIFSKLSTTKMVCDDAAKSHRILASLLFEEMPLRRLQIPETYRDTFSWIYETGPFGAWLECQSGTFWINGKAGSGKSTMMKMISDDPRTLARLSTWAAGQSIGSVVQASFFFWSGGSSMQKSEEGLLRSLAYQLLRQCPDVIPDACHRKWTADLRDRDALGQYSRRELLAIINSATRWKCNTCRFCFVIDGLDEYDGDHYELVQTLARISRVSTTKLVLSSRPWTVFKKAYGDSLDRSLVLQDLTKDDIDAYIHGKFLKDARFQALAAEDSSVLSLAEEIRDRAQGVFLWVFLVVRSLLRGLTEDDDISILLRRLREIPDSLEKYFQKMLDSVESVYSQYTACSLLVVFTAGTPLPLRCFFYLQVGVQNTDFALGAEINPLTARALEEERRIATSNVNKWNRDLLEVVRKRGVLGQSEIFDQQVTFLHRTARDYLMESGVQSLLRTSVGNNFKPELALGKIFLRLAKTVREPFRFRSQDLDQAAARAMHYFKRYEVVYDGPCPELVCELDRVGNRIRPPNAFSYWTDCDPEYAKNPEITSGEERWSIFEVDSETMAGEFDHLSDRRRVVDGISRNLEQESLTLHRRRNLLAYAVEFDLMHFVEQWLRVRPRDIFKIGGAPLLYHALTPVLPLRLTDTVAEPSHQMIKLLFSRGADPNEKIASWQGDTVGDRLLRSIPAGERDLHPKVDLASPRLRFLEESDLSLRSLFLPLRQELELAAVKKYGSAGVVSYENEQEVPSGTWTNESDLQRCIDLVELFVHHHADLKLLSSHARRTITPRLCGECQQKLDAVQEDNFQSNRNTPSWLRRIATGRRR